MCADIRAGVVGLARLFNNIRSYQLTVLQISPFDWGMITVATDPCSCDKNVSVHLITGALMRAKYGIRSVLHIVVAPEYRLGKCLDTFIKQTLQHI